MSRPNYREFVTQLLDKLRWAGVEVLDEMEKSGELTNEDRRILQYVFVGGVNDAHFAMAEPVRCVRSEREEGKQHSREFEIRYGIKHAVEDFLEQHLGAEWRVAEIDPNMSQNVALGALLHRFRDAVRAKPSNQVKKLEES